MVKVFAAILLAWSMFCGAAETVVSKIVPGSVFDVDSGRSEILIQVYRGGLLSVLGHNHVIAARSLAGSVQVGDNGQVSATLVIPVQILQVDEQKDRERAGEDFESVPSAADIEGTRRNMLGEHVLQAHEHPEIKILAHVESCDGNSCMASVDINVRNNKTRYSVPLKSTLDAGTLRVQGGLEIEQTALGIQPFEVLGGTLRVADTLFITFDIYAAQMGVKES
ncbi:MAG: hypothetical protein ACWA5Q_00415 [bacterium]